LHRNFEVCSYDIRDLVKIVTLKPARIEFCQNKNVGGLTPNLNDLDYAVSTGISIHPIIRPREGNFIYSKKEMDQMIKDIEVCKEKNCKGVVFGVLDKNFSIDIKKCERLMMHSEGLSTTFHMAFDSCKNPIKSMKNIIDLGFERILTSGRKNNVKDGLEFIEKLVNESDDLISIMPGSNLRSSNVELFLKNKRIKDFHSSCYVNGTFSIEEAKLLNTKIKNF
tara:strand:+ start:535 stop:1203 length:669 start_codon:yes stop_codon:yes gene_type:complete